jgi:pyruvate,orthophosphate dikinase
MAKWVYAFGGGRGEGSAGQRDLLGGKGANLAEMSRIGLPVPPGFTITTEVCNAFYANDREYPEGLRGEVEGALSGIGDLTGRVFGDDAHPLLLSVRSGARASMPGMMDTVLNLGLNDRTVEALAAESGDARFAYDSYRRFIQMYANVVMGMSHNAFEHELEALKEARGCAQDTDLNGDDLRGLVTTFHGLVQAQSGTPFPQDPHKQLWGAIGAVFQSWMSRRAIVYRHLNNIPESWGTAVTVQAMVFGNMGAGSSTGVMFTRNPSTGENTIYGEFLENAQGEDVVAGIRTPRYIMQAAREGAGANDASMEEALPHIHVELMRVASVLEGHFRDMQDIEFTVERGQLFVLQTRSGKRTAAAAVRIAVELERDGVISQDEALLRVDAGTLDQLLHPALDPQDTHNVIGKGLPASPGAASGEIVFSAEDAESLRQKGRRSILVRIETSPEDINGMDAAEGILTVRGGMTSHAAVVARGMGKPCVCGAGDLRIDLAAGTLTAGDTILRAGDKLTIDGTTGRILTGEVAMIDPEPGPEFAVLMGWADARRRLKVRANAETARDARTARAFGAEGIGLARTEHMFFEGDRILAVREMILAEDKAGRVAALEKLLPSQREDFIELFEIMAGLPVTIRLLDPPLHEFLPHSEAEIAEVAEALGTTPERLRDRSHALAEANPMLGFRGCRLAIIFPEITVMQARAIFEAVAEVRRRTGVSPVPEIMVPLITGRREFDIIKRIIDDTAEVVAEETGAAMEYQVGTMIELPRAALKSGEIAETAEFFSFGTNDLTQTAFGISRDDAATFLNEFVARGIFDADPFVSIDESGVGELIEIAAARGRAVRPNIKLGICGEHGGDPASVAFCDRAGLDYVSCSPFRVPIARLAAAQAAVRRQS